MESTASADNDGDFNGASDRLNSSTETNEVHCVLEARSNNEINPELSGATIEPHCQTNICELTEKESVNK